MDQERADALLHELGQALVNDPEVSQHDWEGLAFVAEVSDGFASSFFGYLFVGEERSAFCPDSEEVFELLGAFHAATCEGEESSWVACLIQIKMPEGTIKLSFEHKDPKRWAVTPRNIDTMPASLRPE